MWRWVYLVTVPLGWAVLLVFHPNPDPDDIYGSLRDDTTRWLLVHGGTLLFIDLLAVGVYLLVRDLTGTFATISRVGAGVFATFYGAGEAVLGIATGVLVRHANTVPDGERAGAASAAQALWNNVITDDLILGVGAVGWAVGVLAAAVAVRRAGAPLSATVVLGLSTVTLMHGPPIGPVGLLFFTAAVVLLMRHRLRQTDPASSDRLAWVD
jgi:hypothetical protein